MAELTQELLKKILHYNPGTGFFIWKKRGRLLGKMAGGIGTGGYVRINISGKLHLAHRLAWLYVQGEFPENVIDHINGITGDNSLENLRACTRSENMRNARKRCDNTSGFKGVSWSKCANKWKACISISGEKRYLGIFNNPKDAAIAYNNAALILHGEFAHLNEVLQ